MTVSFSTSRDWMQQPASRIQQAERLQRKRMKRVISSGTSVSSSNIIPLNQRSIISTSSNAAITASHSMFFIKEPCLNFLRLPRSRQGTIALADEVSSTVIRQPAVTLLDKDSPRSEKLLILSGIKARNSAAPRAKCTPSKTALLELLPDEILLHVLAFAGPHSVSRLAQTSQAFHGQLCGDLGDTAWRVLGESYGKWNMEQAQPHGSWKSLYFQNILVPVDFMTISRALDAFAANQSDGLNSLIASEDLTIFLRSGKHYATKPITINAFDHPTAKITIRGVPNNLNTEFSTILSSQSETCDEPLFRVQHGSLTLRDLDLHHESQGVDLWNGNAAIFVQPSSTLIMDDGSNDYNNTLLSAKAPAASVLLQSCSIRSTSGRGVSATGHASVQIEDCCIHDCAATGVYVAGETASLSVRDSDIIRNGQGNMIPGGVRRGHSGVYVEAGRASIHRCSVAQNAAAGVSMVAGGKASLRLAHSSIVGNERAPLDLPLLEMDRHFLEDSNLVSPFGASNIRVMSSTLRRSHHLAQGLNAT